MINVVSLFDGMSCGRIALERIGQPVGMYARSEINKHASIVARANYPLSYDLGDVTKWRDWAIEWGGVDLIMGGSPCQGFSRAGQKGGTKAVIHDQEFVVDTLEKYEKAKDAGALFLSQSHLFWEFVAIINHCKSHNPSVKILLENVVMPSENLKMITRALQSGDPVLIDSAYFSAQRRNRYYWCNWHVDAFQKEDSAQFFSDILQPKEDTPAEFKVSPRQRKRLDFTKCSDGGARICFTHTGENCQKSPCLLARDYKGISNRQMSPISVKGGEPYHLTPLERERLQTVPDNYTAAVPKRHRLEMLGNGWTVDVIAHLLKQGGFGS